VLFLYGNGIKALKAKGEKMIAENIKTNMLKPFIDETIKTLEEMAHLKSHADEAFIDNVDNFRFKGYAIAAKTSGNLNMVILLHNYIETALAIGNRLRFNILNEVNELPEVNEEMQAALAEWGNTAIGRATQSLDTLKLGIRFDPPYFILNTENMEPLLKNVQEIISVPIHIDDVGRFYLNLLMINRNAGEEKAVPKIQTGEKILVVDDSKFIRLSMKRFLNSLGYENIVEAANGLEAVEMHAKEKPAIIFMDVVMPEMTGDEALEKIRATDSDTPIVILSSVTDNTVIDRCNQVGVSGYIVKPLTAEDGPDRLKEFL
jgi:CheY-like chemotaxis protein/CheY-specific phosphatase CheX